MKPNPDKLDRLLRSWSEVPAPSGRLPGPVWQRIESGLKRGDWFGQAVMLLHELDARFARPQAIAALLAFAMALGVGLAELHVRRAAMRNDAEMSVRYISLLETENR
jgi:hypothetical protein